MIHGYIKQRKYELKDSVNLYKQVIFAPLEAHRYFLWNDTDTDTLR